MSHVTGIERDGFRVCVKDEFDTEHCFRIAPDIGEHLVRCVNAAPELKGMVLHLIACQRSGNTLVLVQAVAEVARAFARLDLEGVDASR